MEAKTLKNILEAGLLVAGRAMSIAQLESLFQHESEKPERAAIKDALEQLQKEYEGRGIELVKIASGYRLQSHESVAQWITNLFQERSPRYSRALLETLVLIAYRQPITRAEIEDVRGVAVSSNIVKTLQERQWVKVLGHKDVPGKPALLGTSKEFLDYFNLQKLEDLPALADIKDLDQFEALLADEAELETGDEQADDESDIDDEYVAPTDTDKVSSEHSSAEDDDSDDGEGSDGNDDDGSANSELHANGVNEQPVDADEEDGSANHDESQDAPQNQQEDDDAAAHLHGESPDPATTYDKADTDEIPADQQLLRAISEFADEHQEQVDARDKFEAHALSTPIVTAQSLVESGEDPQDQDPHDLSQVSPDELQPGDMPEPGSTLH